MRSLVRLQLAPRSEQSVLRSLNRADLIAEVVMRVLRRALLAVSVGTAVAAVLRLRGSGGVPPRQGSWRQLSGPDFR